ncbi:MAG: hydroxymethylglutaryl-CoA synthase [Candidatus Nezhaarchaeales archaeon]
MSSEPIERRVSYVGDKLRCSYCPACGKSYFGTRRYCGYCGRDTLGKMKRIDLFFEKGVLESFTVITEPTNRFKPLNPYVYGLISFDNGKICLPGRLTDYFFDGGLENIEGREVLPRIRRRYSVGKSDIIPTISLTFTFADEYYPHQEYRVTKPSKEYEKPGIVGFASYTSRFRIREGSVERSVPFIDEDAITAAVEACKLALIHSGVNHSLIGKVYAGSESNPYAVKPIASKVAQVLDLGVGGEDVRGVDAIDTQFACKAATSVFKDAVALTYYPDSGVEYAMVVGTDNSQAAPRGKLGGELDFFVGYGAAAFIFGRYDVVAEVEAWYSCTSDTADFWRRDTELYPRHGGRFTGEPAYFKHVEHAARKLMDKLRLQPNDVQYFVPHQPNASFPVKVARKLGFKEEQYAPGLQVSKFGNLYSGSSPLGLVAVLEQAKPYERILLVSYGSGAGSDAYTFITTPQITEKRQKFTVKWQASNPFLKYVDYNTYRRFKRGL